MIRSRFPVFVVRFPVFAVGGYAPTGQNCFSPPPRNAGTHHGRGSNPLATIKQYNELERKRDGDPRLGGPIAKKKKLDGVDSESCGVFQ